MLKKHLTLLLISLFLTSCIGYKKVAFDDNNEPILTEKMKYKITQIPNEKDLTKIDTSAYYVQVFEGRYYNDNEKENPMVLIFHNDGYFKKTSILYDSIFEYRNKNSAFYGGKYRITENKIELEGFYPSHGGKTNYYVRLKTIGNIEGDRIIIYDKQHIQTIYEKKYTMK